MCDDLCTTRLRLESLYSRTGTSLHGICSNGFEMCSTLFNDQFNVHFIVDFSSEYDYVLVFKMEGEGENKKQSDIAKYFVSVLKKHDFKVFSYLSVQADELIILLKPSVLFNKLFCIFQ